MTKRIFSVLLAFIMVSGLVLSLGGNANAATTNSALWRPNVSPESTAQLGSLRILESAGGSLKEGDWVNISLPSYVELEQFKVGTGTSATTDLIIISTPVTVEVSDAGFTVSTVENTVYAFGEEAPLKPRELNIAVLSKNSFNLIVRKSWNPFTTLTLRAVVSFDRVKIKPVAPEDLETSEVRVTLSAPSTAGFSSGTVAVGTLLTAGGSSITAASPKNITDIGGSIADITLKEDVVGALEENGADFTKEETIKLVLSPGFTWDRVELSRYGGFSETGINILSDIVTERDGRSALYLGIDKKTGKNPGELVIRATVKTSGNLTSARDVKVTYGGTNPGVGGERIAEVTVAKYLVPGLTSAAKSTLDVVAGRKNQQIGSFTVAEGMPGDLPKGRVIRLTLPEGAKWNRPPTVTREAGNGALTDPPSTRDDGRTLVYTVSATSTSRTIFCFKNATVDLALGVPEELTVTVKGPGIDSAATVVNVQAPVTLSAGGGTVRIGAQEQAAGVLTIQENLAGALRARDAAGNRAVLKLTLPQGVRFAKTPVVKVADGDLELAASGGGLLDNNRTLVIPVELSSATPVEKKPSGDQSNNGSEAVAELVGSIIEVREIFLTLDRSVPEGDITLEVSGSALSETEGLFSSTDNQLTWVLARCVTLAQDAVKKEAVFTIGSNKYLIGGEEREMDVEPYIKDGRTYAPVRYLAYAAGLTEDNILWDGQRGVVTLLTGNRTIQFKVGKKSYLIQGMAISIDAAPEIVSGRTMLPYRFVAQALGLQAQWDEAARQVVIR
jgi:hypothetical protein